MFQLLWLLIAQNVQIFFVLTVLGVALPSTHRHCRIRTAFNAVTLSRHNGSTLNSHTMMCACQHKAKVHACVQ